MVEPRLKMVEPKLSENKEKAAKPESKPEQEAPAKPEEQRFWTWVQSVKSLSVNDLALFKVGEGVVLVPTDALARPLLDCSLYFDKDALGKLLAALEK